MLPAQRAELERLIQRTTLPNGLDVIVVENRGVPLVTIEADVKNGSFTQATRVSRGCRTCTSTCSSRRTRTIRTPTQFVARASELGAVFNGTTSEERVNYYLTVPADSVEGGMKFLAAALIYPALSQRRAGARARGRDRRIRSQRVESILRLHAAMGKALWTTAWSRKNPLGEREVIQSTTPEKMRAIQQRYYVPNNTAIIVTGDVAAEKAFALAKTHLRRMASAGRSASRTDPIPPIPPLTQTRRSSSSSRLERSS